MNIHQRLPGQILGTHSYLSQYLDGRDWLLWYRVPCDPLRFVCAVGNRILTVPNRYVHDFASIPRTFWRLIGPPTGHGDGAAYGPAAILHDWAYERQTWDDGTQMTRQQADALFWEAMMDLDVDEWRADVMYGAVRAFGRWNFRGHRHWGKPPTSDYTPEGGIA